MLNKNKIKIDFIGIGAMKCATTWIYECLRSHPDVFIPEKDIGDTNFFNFSNYEEKIQEYKPYKRNKDKKLGNFNVWYLEKNKAPERIKKHNSEAKIIVSLRSPVDRAFSEYLHKSSFHNENWKSFEDAFKKDKQIIERGFYYKYLKEYFELFSHKNILIIFLKDIKNDSNLQLKRIFEFLNIKSSLSSNLSKLKVAPTKFKLTKLGRFIHKKIVPKINRISLFRKIKNNPFVKQNYYNFSHFYANLKNKPKPSIKKETRTMLQEIYREDIKKLEKLISRDLSFWK